jgi:exosortase family protein XrtF
VNATGTRTRQQNILGIPQPIKLFLLKVSTFYISWSLLYVFVLQPNRVVDAYLTRNLGALTATLMQLILPSHSVQVIHDALMSSLQIDGSFNIFILDGCNGLELYVLYVGFILCFPFKNNSTLKYIVLGLLSIFLLNLLRCTVLSYLKFHKVSYFDIIHHYIFTITVYSFICALWYRYITENLRKANIKDRIVQ